MTDTVVETTEQSDAPTAIPHWISGARREGKGRTAPVYNPALGRVVSEVGLASADEVSEAIATAKAAFPAWRDLSIAKRQAVMFRFRELIVQRKDVVELDMTVDQALKYIISMGVVPPLENK